MRAEFSILLGSSYSCGVLCTVGKTSPKKLHFYKVQFKLASFFIWEAICIKSNMTIFRRLNPNVLYKYQVSQQVLESKLTKKTFIKPQKVVKVLAKQNSFLQFDEISSKMIFRDSDNFIQNMLVHPVCTRKSTTYYFACGLEKPVKIIMDFFPLSSYCSK